MVLTTKRVPLTGTSKPRAVWPRLCGSHSRARRAGHSGFLEDQPPLCLGALPLTFTRLNVTSPDKPVLSPQLAAEIRPLLLFRAISALHGCPTVSPGSVVTLFLSVAGCSPGR